MSYGVFAQHFRGFKWIDLELEGLTFLVGDNSSGKSSLLYLIDSIFRNDLDEIPLLNEELGLDPFDYFSPYFNDGDVTFGYWSTAGKHFSKIITLKQRVGRSPEVVSCSLLANGHFLTVKKWRTVNRKRVIENFVFKDPKQLFKQHQDTSGFKNARRVPRSLSLCQPGIVFFAFDHDEIDGENTVDELFNRSGLRTRINSPLRDPPSKYYNFQRRISTSGSHFATSWHKISHGQVKWSMASVNRFGSNSGLFEKLKVNRIAEEEPDSPLIVKVQKNGKSFYVDQVGIGVSQVVPVLVDSLLASLPGSRRLALFQQPELHLHPVAQAALGSFFFECSVKGLSGILETHSNYLIDRYRADFRDATKDEKKQAKATIIFCSSNEKGNSAKNILVLPDGKLNDAPSEYYGFFVDELLRTMF